MAAEQIFGRAFSGMEDALVGLTATGKLEFQSLADSILADISRIAVRQGITAPAAGLLESALGSVGGSAAGAGSANGGGGLFGLFHEGGIAGGRPPGARHADPGIFEHAPRYHGGGFAGSGLLPDEVPIIARRGELVVPAERVVREERGGPEQRSDGPSCSRGQRPITVVVNVTAADASSFRASQGQIATDMARAIDRASRNR
jgi:hypothetical protein